MILEKRASRQVAKKIHLMQKVEEKPGKEVGENEQESANAKDKECKKAERKECQGDSEKKLLQHNKDQTGPRSVIAKPVSIQDQTQTAVGKSNPAANACMTKTSYNPITHVSSESCITVYLINKLHRIRSISIAYKYQTLTQTLVHVLFIS